MSSDVSLVFNVLAKDKASAVVGGFGNTLANLGNRLKTFATLAATGFAGGIIIGQIRGIIDAASDLNEAQNKIQVLFGSDTAAIQTWAAHAATAMGMSTLAATDAAATMGVFGKSAGLTGQGLVNFSTQMAGLSADFASFYNTSPEDAMIAIGAALRGESEPIRRYGILLDDATLRNRAFAMGITKTTKDVLTPQQRVLAAQAEILRQSTAAQGDFARTSGGLANQQRILSAQLTNVRAELGAHLLPIAVKIAMFFTGTLVPAFENFIHSGNRMATIKHVATQIWDVIQHKLWPVIVSTVGALRDFAGWAFGSSNGAKVFRAVVIGLTAAFVAWKVAVTAVRVATTIYTAAQWLLNAAMYANPIGLIILAVVGLVAAFVYLWHTSEGFRNFWKGLWSTIWGAISGVWDWIKTHWPLLLEILTGPIGFAAKFIYDHWDAIVAFVKAMPGRIAAAAVGLWDGVIGSFKAAINWLIKAWNDFHLTIGGGSFLGYDLPSFTLNTPDIPLLDRGGTVTRTGLAVVHEGEEYSGVGVHRRPVGVGGFDITFRGNLDSAFATAFMLLCRKGLITITPKAIGSN